MISKQTAQYSLRKLAKSKSRSILTILSIFIGIATIYIFISFGWGLYNYVNTFTTSSTVDKINIQPKGIGAPGLDDTFALTEDDLTAIQRTKGVIEATGGYIKAGELKSRGEIKFVFLDIYDPKIPLFEELAGLKIAQGRKLKSSDTGKVVLGYNYLIPKKIFTNALGLNDEIEIQGKKFKIVGFYGSIGNPQDDSNVYINDNSKESLFPGAKDKYNWIIARADINEIDSTVKEIEKSLRKSRDVEEGKEDFFVASFKDMLESYLGALNIIVGFVILIALVSVLVSAINTANTMVTSVLERIKEIGVIKSIGAKNSEVFGIFLFESGFLGFVGGVIGVTLGF